MTRPTLVETLRMHLPRDRYDEMGIHDGTYCTCGGWEGGYFADGDAGPFDEHLAAAIEDWMTDTLKAETVLGDAGEVVLNALCDSPVWADRHIGDLEQHLADGFANAALSVAVVALTKDLL